VYAERTARKTAKLPESDKDSENFIKVSSVYRAKGQKSNKVTPKRCSRDFTKISSACHAFGQKPIKVMPKSYVKGLRKFWCPIIIPGPYCKSLSVCRSITWLAQPVHESWTGSMLVVP
jgi:hypothetical protein